jgi:cell division protein FtsB
MRKLIAQRYLIRRNLLGIIALCLCVYFTYHLTFGTRSYFRLLGFEHETARLAVTYDNLHAQRVTLEDKVVRLRPSSLDPDLLEERVREVLGYTRPDERIILMN